MNIKFPVMCEDVLIAPSSNAAMINSTVRFKAVSNDTTLWFEGAAIDEPLVLRITNPAAADTFKVGGMYHVTFTPIE